MTSPTFLSSGAIVTVPSVGNGSASLAVPTVALNDLLVIFYAPTATGNRLNTPTGYTLINEINGDGVGNGLHCWWKLAGASEAATISISSSAGVGNGLAQCLVWRGVNTTTPINTSAVSGAQAAVTSISVPTLTTSSATTTLVAFSIEYNLRSRSFTPGGALVDRSQNATAPSFDICDEAIAASGAVSGRTITPSSPAADFRVIAFAIAPAAASVSFTGAAPVDDLSAAGSFVAAGSGVSFTGAATLDDLSAAGTFAASTAGTFTSDEIYNNVGGTITLAASVAVTTFDLYSNTTGALVVRKTGLSTNASGVVSFVDPLVLPGTSYRADFVLANGTRIMPVKAAT